MHGMHSFEWLSKLNYKPIIVFCTAYDSYALKSFDTFSIDFLVKPIEIERLRLTLDKILKFGAKNENYTYKDLEKLYSIKNTPLPITHKLGNKIIPIKLADVVFFQASDKNVCFYNQKNDDFITD